MVYIKVVPKPPSASHNSEAIQGSPRRNMYIKKSKKGIKKRDKHIQSEASNNIESGIKNHQKPRVYITRTSFSVSPISIPMRRQLHAHHSTRK
jgi:hypothetical protein